MITKYQRGANFERKVLKYLIGDNTSPSCGYLHSLFPAVQSQYPDSTPPILYGQRAAGSKGDFDLLIVGSWTIHHKHMVLGVQCKMGQISEPRMKSDLRRIYRDQHISGVYAVPGATGRHIPPKFFPALEPLYVTLMGETYDG